MHRSASPLLTVLLLLPTAASAADLADYLEAWTVTRTGQDGGDKEDVALGVAITSAKGVVAVGQVDGTARTQHDALALEIAPDQSVTWSDLTDSGQTGVDGRVRSEDAWNGVVVDPVTDDLVLCGTRGLLTAGDPLAMFQVEGRPVAGSTWTRPYRYGTSQIQECQGVDTLGGTTWADGWSQSDTDLGRWIGLKMDGTGTVTQSPTLYDFRQLAGAPDQAHAIAIHAATGEVTLVGERGEALAAGNRNNVDWHVRRYDGAGARIWEATFGGSRNLIDRATDVVIDAVTGDAYVVGYTNIGTDNGANADFDWKITRYGAAGSSGGPDEKWSVTWTSAGGASEGATSVALDETGDLLVAGWAIDSASGNEVWRIGKFAAYDGQDLGSWTGPLGAGDSRPTAIAFRDGLIALGGRIENTQGDGDFAVMLLDVDDDGDGTPNSADFCPDDADKDVDGGVCGCGVSDADSDSDGEEDCLEACDDDPTKTEPGVCGCDHPDDDSDGDGSLDCNDSCPDDPTKTENDIVSGGCGCGVANDDTDGDGVFGCHDACANTPPGTEVDEFGCEPSTTTDETGTPDTTDGDSDGGGGCGCDTATPAASGLLLVGLAALGVRRRRERGVEIE